MAESDNDSVVYHLPIENELRFGVGEESSVVLELLSGYAEISGSELEHNRKYKFPPSSSIGVFSWEGCSVQLTGNTDFAIVTPDTLMILPVNLHACLEELRIKAEFENSKGPISMVVGPTDSGKSTFCRTLLNYAARLGKRPLYIDLDVGQSSVSIPGTISVLLVEKSADIIEGFSQQAMQVYPFGYKSPGHNIALYFLLIKRIGQLIQTRLKNANPNTRSSGIIIDTCGWTRGAGYQAITLAACAFEIDVLFVIDEERLYLQLKKDMPTSVKVVYVPKQYGVFERNRMVRSQTRDNRVWEYFYGVEGNLNPYSINVKFEDIEIFKINSSFDTIVDAENIKFDDVDITPVTIENKLKHQILALSFASTMDENIVATNIIGLVCISYVDVESRRLTVLSPQPGPLPSKICLMGDIRFRPKIS